MSPGSFEASNRLSPDVFIIQFHPFVGVSLTVENDRIFAGMEHDVMPTHQNT